MTRRRLASIAVVAFVLGAAVSVRAAQEWRVEQLAIAPPAALATFEGPTLTGQPSRLAWSPDAREIYFQTRDGAFNDVNAPLRHFIVDAAGGAPREIPVEPEWALDYWTVKSAQVSPDDARVRIALKSDRSRQKTTSVPMGGDLARGGTTTGSSIGQNDAVDAAFSSQIVFTNTMRLHGKVIGRFENTVIVPGLTFGWGPSGTRAIAFASPDGGKVFVMDGRGKRVEIAGTKGALLPAWSPDGRRLVWVERDGRGKVTLKVSHVEQP